MNNEQAYNGVSYEQRASIQYKRGDLVYLGPAYRMGGSYELDGAEGIYTVLRMLRPSTVSPCPTIDYYLARGDVRESIDEESWDLICHPSRMTRIPEHLVNTLHTHTHKYDPLLTYFTVVIPWVPDEFATTYHPEDSKGPLSTLTRGAFPTYEAAICWAKDNLKGTPYSVQYIDAEYVYT